MSPTNKSVIEKKIARLERNLHYLEGYKLIAEEQFEKDHTINGAALHYLVECIEIIIDIGNHILSEDFALSTDTYFDVFIVLGESKVIPDEFAKQHADMAKFRNRIIHVYDDVSLKEVYKVLQSAPDIFKTFSKYYNIHINKL